MIGHCGHAARASKAAGSGSGALPAFPAPARKNGDGERARMSASVLTGSRAAFSRGSPPSTPAPNLSSALYGVCANLGGVAVARHGDVASALTRAAMAARRASANATDSSCVVGMAPSSTDTAADTAAAAAAAADTAVAAAAGGGSAVGS